jgi:hypothetical protein
MASNESTEQPDSPRVPCMTGNSDMAGTQVIAANPFAVAPDRRKGEPSWTSGPLEECYHASAGPTDRKAVLLRESSFSTHRLPPPDVTYFFPGR